LNVGKIKENNVRRNWRTTVDKIAPGGEPESRRKMNHDLFIRGDLMIAKVNCELSAPPGRS